MSGHILLVDDEPGLREAVQAYHEFRADRIIGEVNNGGDLVETVLRTVDPNIPYLAVHASRGKRARAEPIAALYEQQRVHHAGTFPDLEDQMCSFVAGDSGAKSPDRVDALVWALTELALGPGLSWWQDSSFVQGEIDELRGKG